LYAVTETMLAIHMHPISAVCQQAGSPHYTRTSQAVHTATQMIRKWMWISWICDLTSVQSDAEFQSIGLPYRLNLLKIDMHVCKDTSPDFSSLTLSQSLPTCLQICRLKWPDVAFSLASKCTISNLYSKTNFARGGAKSFPEYTPPISTRCAYVLRRAPSV